MKLLVDTDAFCKLGVAELLSDAATIFDAQLVDCGTLPALPYMLRKGALPRRYGGPACNALLRLAEKTHTAPSPSIASLEPFAAEDAVDPGEAQLFAAAAEFGLPMVSGDKRAVRSLRGVDAAHSGLDGRIVTLEALLLSLYEQRGPGDFLRRVRSLAEFDTVVKVCVSSNPSDPREGLRSYYYDLVGDLEPLTLWCPPGVEPT